MPVVIYPQGGQSQNHFLGVAPRHGTKGSVKGRSRRIESACAAARTADNVYQGAIIYRRDGVSLLQPNTGAVYVEYIASAPHNRPDYAEKPLYSGVGEGLMYLAMLDSYQWGLGGRVALFSLPSAVGFHKKMKFFPTGSREDGMIHCELTPEAAVEFMQDKGLI